MVEGQDRVDIEGLDQRLKAKDGWKAGNVKGLGEVEGG